MVVGGGALIAAVLVYALVRGRGRPPGPAVALVMMLALLGGLLLVAVGAQS
jgi:hypothetical protein